MNLLHPQRILVATGDPRSSWIVLAHTKKTAPLSKSRVKNVLKIIVAGITVGALVFFAVPPSLAFLWNVAAKQAAPKAEPPKPLPVAPATVGGAILPQTLPTQPATATAPAQVQTATAESRNAQDRIIIPKIGVNMPVIAGKTEQTLLHGAWLSPWGSKPDQGGNTTIFGHRFLRLYPNPETFHALDRLTMGDAFDIHWDNKIYHYTVVDTRVVPPEDVSVMNPTTKPSVTLITCTPVFTTKNRLVVRGELTGITP